MNVDVVEIMEKFACEMRLRANEEETEGFVVVPGYKDMVPGLYISMSRRFLLGRIEGASYTWAVRLLVDEDMWLKANLEFIAKRLHETGVYYLIPDWDVLGTPLPEKVKEFTVFVPHDDAMKHGRAGLMPKN